MPNTPGGQIWGDIGVSPAARGEETTERERYRQLVELAPDGILIHYGEQIVMVNAALLRLLGATDRRQVIGRPITDFLTPPFLRGVEARLVADGAGASAGAGQGATADTLCRLDGTRIEVEVTAIPFMDRGKLAAHLIVRDIRERLAAQVATHRAEEQLREAQKLEAIGALAGGVAHEVNNMMVVVLGAADFLLLDPGLGECHLGEVREIRVAAVRAATLTRQLLSFSQRAFHSPHVLDLDRVLSDIEPVLRRLLGSGPTLAVTCGGPLRVRVDSGQVGQMIVNLVLNARDATPREGTLTILTEPAAVKAGEVTSASGPIPPGRYGVLRVRDTGTGIDATTMTRLFEPFFTTKPLGRGTGLGLSAVYGVMEQNAGYIRVESVPGSGSTFSLYFPLTPEDAPAVQGVLPTIPHLTRRTGANVLVVEDEPAVRRMAGRILKAGGFHATLAEDGAAALEAIEKNGPPDMVITDLMMPGISGAELASRLAASWPGIPVLFMSGYSATHVKENMGIDLVVNLLQKPFTSEELLQSVDVLFGLSEAKLSAT